MYFLINTNQYCNDFNLKHANIPIKSKINSRSRVSSISSSSSGRKRRTSTSSSSSSSNLNDFINDNEPIINNHLISNFKKTI